MNINKLNTNSLVGGGGVKTSKRTSNIELYRVLVMMSIVAHHYVVNSGVLEYLPMDNLGDLKSDFLWIFGMWGKTGINCFVLITGYFMCQSHITVRKFLKLTSEVLFYNILFYIVFFASGKEHVSLHSVYHVLWPIIDFKSSFTSCYLAFYLFIPFLNILIQNMTRKMHVRLIGLCILFFTIWDQLPEVEMLGYTVWFGVLYVIGAYFRLYENRSWLINGSCRGTVICVLLSVGSVLFTIQMRHWGISNWWPMHWVSDSDAPFAVLTSVALFNFFRKLSIPQSRIINALGASSFGVLCIHANSDAMRQWLWCDTVDCVGHFHDTLMPLYAIGTIIAIYLAFSVIDQVRIRFLEKPYLRLYDKFATRWLSEVNGMSR